LKRFKRLIKGMFLPGIFFEELGFKYFGPFDGHNTIELTRVLNRIKKVDGPILMHVVTIKGKGYEFSEKKPSKFHGIAPFETETGELAVECATSFAGVFGDAMMEIAAESSEVVAISAAMSEGTGLEQFAKMYPARFFDVGIAEQHAITMACGLARGGMKPVVAIYSTFLQRAYDQILHDLCIQNLHVVIAIDRAGVVGQDGETHQGLFDISFLRSLPNMTILAPAVFEELPLMLDFAFFKQDGPIAIRYPKDADCSIEFEGTKSPVGHGSSDIPVRRDDARPRCGNGGHPFRKVWIESGHHKRKIPQAFGCGRNHRLRRNDDPQEHRHIRGQCHCRRIRERSIGNAECVQLSC
jgi:1-deoxy-D-xylulose-5-phosphate synthase